jgi:hypothetical protein
MTGMVPVLAMCATAFEIWSKLFSMLAGMVKTSPMSQRVYRCGREEKESKKFGRDAEKKNENRYENHGVKQKQHQLHTHTQAH